MARKVKIDGPFLKDNAIDYVEDIINSDGVTLISTQFIKSGDNIYNVIVIYDDGVVTPGVTKARKKEVVK